VGAASCSQVYDHELQHQRCKIFNTTKSIVLSKNKKLIIPYCKNALAYYNAGVVAVISKVVGLSPKNAEHTFRQK
jgi:hypothetical protein